MHDATTWDNGTGFADIQVQLLTTAEAISGITLGAGICSGNIEIDQILVYGLKK